MPDLALLVNLLQLAVTHRTQLALENIALRHQLAVYKRSVQRPNIKDGDRIFWLTVIRMLKEWREALVFVQPDTVIKWHRKGFKYYWRKKSRAKPGRPPISMALIHLIRRLSIENVLWGAPRIVDELGHHVAESTVAKYMVKHRAPDPEQSWKTFLHNHVAETAACDFFIVPTVTFQRLFCFVVMSLDRRRILHVNVTKHPTSEWTYPSGEPVDGARGYTGGPISRMLIPRLFMSGSTRTRIFSLVGEKKYSASLMGCLVGSEPACPGGTLYW